MGPGFKRATLRYCRGAGGFGSARPGPRGPSRVALVGQIQNRKQPGKWLGDVMVLLVSGKQVLALAVSNSLGEFQMQYAPTKRLRLYVPVRQAGKRIEMLLTQPIGRTTREGRAGAKKALSARKEQGLRGGGF